MSRIFWVNKSAGYIPGAVNLGVVKFGEEALLVDAGLNPDSAKKALKALQEEELTLRYVFNTHSHADHCGGNAFLKRKVKNLTILAPSQEAVFIENPFYEPVYLYGGAEPISQLKTSFLMAEPSQIDTRVEEGKIVLRGKELQFVNLAGHSPFQMGLLAEDVFFCADVLFSPEIWEKHRFVYFFNPFKTKESLEKLKDIKASYYVPSHAEPSESISGLADFNIGKIERFEEGIVDVLKEENLTFDEILAKLAEMEKIEFSNFPSYFLASATVRAYLSNLLEEGKLEVSLKRKILWKAK
jgi:glyoxylase-like metal-dependent hydrolase (beta-lactamase superfamily II)